MHTLTSKRRNGVDALELIGECWLVGDWQRAEFATATLTNGESWARYAALDQVAEAAREASQPPELLFLAQDKPGAFEQHEVDRLQHQFPLTRIVVVAGTWCEGELRTGRPLSGVIRLYWYELAPWWQASVRRVEAGLCPLWSLPLQDPRSGRWSHEGNLLRAENLKDVVLIDSDDFSVYETLHASLADYGMDSAWSRTCDEAERDFKLRAGIWDGGQLGEPELKQLQRFCKRIEGPVIALLDFPRREHLQQAQRAGAKAVLAKPYIVEELVAVLGD